MKTVVTREAGGKRPPFFIPGQTTMETEEALTDIFDRLHRGAKLGYSGYCHCLINYVDNGNTDEGWDKATYANCPDLVVDFIIHGSRWWQEEELEAETPDMERFLRLCLLRLTLLTALLSDSQLSSALALPRDEFLSAIAMTIDDGTPLPELFY